MLIDKRVRPVPQRREPQSGRSLGINVKGTSHINMQGCYPKLGSTDNIINTE